MISARTVLVGVTTAIAMLVGAEAAVRLDDWSRYGTPLSSHATDVGDLRTHDEDGEHARANGRFRHFRIDSLGFRGPDRSRAELADALLIVASGASETFGLYEPADEEWPRRVESRLAAHHVAAATPIVLNAAFAGMTMPTVAQDIRIRISRLRPAFVVYYPTPSQYLDEKVPTAAKPDSSGSWPETLPPTLRFRQRLRDAAKQVVPEVVLDRMRTLQTAQARHDATTRLDFTANVESRLQHFEQDLRHLIGDARRIGAQPVLIVHAHRFADTLSVSQQRQLRAWAKFYPLVSGRELLLFDSLAAVRTRVVAQDSGIALVDPIAGLRAAGEAAFADHTHFTAIGADIVASAVADTIAGRVVGRAPVSSPDSTGGSDSGPP